MKNRYELEVYADHFVVLANDNGRKAQLYYETNENLNPLKNTNQVPIYGVNAAVGEAQTRGYKI